MRDTLRKLMISILTATGRKQERYINQMAYNIDGRIIDFFDNNRNFATTLKKIVRAKNPFPQINLGKSNQPSLVLLPAFETLPGTSD